MKRIFKSQFLVMILSGIFSMLVVTKATANLPAYQDKYVNDFANVITAEDEAKLELQLSNLYLEEDLKLIIVTDDFPKRNNVFRIKDVAKEVYFKWKINKISSEKGIILLVSTQDNMASLFFGKKARFDYEHKFTKILKEDINPALQNGDYHIGVYEGTQKMLDDIQSPFEKFSSNKYVMLVVGFIILFYLMKNGWLDLGAFTVLDRRRDDDYYDDY